MELIDWFEGSNWEQIVTLDNKLYTLYVTYNTRDTGWYITITTIDDEVLVAGRKLILNVDVFNTVTSNNKPNGLLLMYSEIEGVDITRDNVGTETFLMYIGNDEIL